MELNELFKTIHLGIYKANELFTEWTGGWWLQAYGVEGFLVAKIAEAIMNPKNENRPGFLTLETSFAALYESSRKPIGRKGDAASDRNRVDIALYHKNDTLSHVIEVKRFWSPECFRDLDRLCSLYQKCGRKSGGPRLQAIFVQLLDVGIKRGEKNIERHFEMLEERCSEYLESKYGLGAKFSRGTEYYKPILTDDKSEAFSSFCLSISG